MKLTLREQICNQGRSMKKYESVFFIPWPPVNFHLNRGDFLLKIRGGPWTWSMDPGPCFVYVQFSPLDIILWVWHSVATLRVNLNTIEYFPCYITIRRECSWQLRLLLNRKSLQRKFLLYFPGMGLHCKFKFHSSTKKYYLINRKRFPWLHSLI